MQRLVFPTCVGVFLSSILSWMSAIGLPHVRGGVSVPVRTHTPSGLSSPRAWGCFHRAWRQRRPAPVFPTCVGVFPPAACCWMPCACLPHVRGGVSRRDSGRPRPFLSSPRAWGCFFAKKTAWPSGTVFPTCVGVFPTIPYLSARPLGLPHVRGGVSFLPAAPCRVKTSSPRAWGCF